MGKVYSSVRGKEIDMEKLQLRNETEIAVGNAKLNARGDEIGTGGKIVRTREEILQDYYNQNPRAVREEVTSRKNIK
jgi:hypothetical protein